MNPSWMSVQHCLVVLTLVYTAILIPMYPQAMEVVHPIKKARVVNGNFTPAGSAAKAKMIAKKKR